MVQQYSYFCCGSVYLKHHVGHYLLKKYTAATIKLRFWVILFFCFFLWLGYSKFLIYLITHLTMSETYFSFKRVCCQSNYLLSHNLWLEALQSKIIHLILKRRVIYLLWQVRIIKNECGGKGDFWDLTCCWWTYFSITPNTFEIMSNVVYKPTAPPLQL